VKTAKKKTAKKKPAKKAAKKKAALPKHREAPPPRIRKKPVPGRRPGRAPEPRVMDGAELRRAREAAKWSLRGLAERLRISGASLHALETGDGAVISARRARQIVSVFKRGRRDPPALLPAPFDEAAAAAAARAEDGVDPRPPEQIQADDDNKPATST
jgi:transcriptional regulator with XRE-family HTH domain